MLKNKLNRKFRQIIALSILAAIGCSSSLIQSTEVKQSPTDLILNLTQEDRQKLLALISKQETVNVPKDFQAKYPCTLNRDTKVQDNDELDDVGDHCRGWIQTAITLQLRNEKENLYFDLLKNKKDNKIYFMHGLDTRRLYMYYEELKGTEFDPETYEKRIWSRPNDFAKFCDKLLQDKRALKERNEIVISEGFDRAAKGLGVDPKLATAGIVVASVYSASRIGNAIVKN